MPAHRSSKSSPLSRGPLHITNRPPAQATAWIRSRIECSDCESRSIMSGLRSWDVWRSICRSSGTVEGNSAIIIHPHAPSRDGRSACRHALDRQVLPQTSVLPLRMRTPWLAGMDRVAKPQPESVGELYELIRHCQSGELYFSPITRNEYEAAERNYTAAAPGPLFPASPPNYGYCNIGRRFVPTHRIQDGPKSTKEVDEVETAVPTVTEGLPIIMKDSAFLVWSRRGYRYRDFIHGCEDPEDPIDDW